MDKKLISEITRFREILSYNKNLITEGTIGGGLKEFLEKMLKTETNITTKNEIEYFIEKSERTTLDAFEKNFLESWLRQQERKFAQVISLETKTMNEAELKYFFDNMKNSLDNVLGPGSGEALLGRLEKQEAANLRKSSAEKAEKSLNAEIVAKNLEKEIDSIIDTLDIGSALEAAKLKGSDVAKFNKIKPKLKQLNKQIKYLEPAAREELTEYIKQINKFIPNLPQTLYGKFRNMGWKGWLIVAGICFWAAGKLGIKIPVGDTIRNMFEGLLSSLNTDQKDKQEDGTTIENNLEGFKNFLRKKGIDSDGAKIDGGLFITKTGFMYMYKNGTFELIQE
jgi:hypothetical protein